MKQRSWLQRYLRVMSRQIQWNDGRVTELDLLSNTQSTWTALGSRTWSVLLKGERFKVECEKGPDEKGHVVVRINGVRSTVRVMDERTQLLEKMGMSVVAGAGSQTFTPPCLARCCKCWLLPETK